MLQRTNPPDVPGWLFRSVACSLALFAGSAALRAAPPSIVQDKAQQKARASLKQPAAEEPVVRLYFISVPWAKVLEDVAEGTNSTLVLNDTPPGRYSRQDMRRYTRAQAVRILNSELERQGYRILEKDEFLTVIKAERSRVEFPRREYHPEAASESSPPEAAATTPPGQRSVSRASQAAAVREPSAVQQAGYDEETETATQPETAVVPETASETVVPQRQSAPELALRVYTAFGPRAELLPKQGASSPGFVVHHSAGSKASSDNAAHDGQDVAFVVAVDNQRNELRVEGPPDAVRSVAELLRRLDQLPATPAAGAPRLVAMEKSKLGIAQRLGPQLRQIQTARRRVGGDEHATAGTGRLLAQAAQAPPGQSQPGETVPPTVPGQYTEQLPADREALLKILLDNLKSEVKMEVIPELNLLMLIGNEADVQKVVEIINAIEQLAIGTVPDIDVYFLQHVDSQSLATMLTTAYEQLGTLRSRTQGAGAQTGAPVSVVPVVKPNAVLILAPKAMLQEIHSLLENLDQPIDPTAEVEVFFLKHAVASQVVTNLEDFYSTRTGLGTKVLATADVRSNAVIVQAQPNDLMEISMLIRKLDKEGPDSVYRAQVFRLKNAIADEVADFLNALLQSVLSPPTGVAGAQQAVAAGGTGTQTTQILREPKAVVLEYVARSPNAKGLVNSGVLEDERLVRSGLLSDIRVNADIRSNSLTVTAPEASMELMEEFIRVLDQPSATIAEIKVFPLKTADATSAVTVLENIFAAGLQQQQQQQLGIQVAGAEDASSALIPLRFTADPRTNSVVAIGGADVMAIVQGILIRLDESDPRTRDTKVIRLKNSPADLAATAINQFLADQRALATLDPDRISTSQLLQQEIIVTPDTVTNSLIISATPTYFPTIEKLVTSLDREPQQVVIQAMLVEVELNDIDEFGVELGFQDSLLFNRSTLASGDITTTTTTNTLPTGVQTQTTNIISQAAAPGFLFNNLPLGNNTATAHPERVGSQGLSNFALGRTNSDLGFGGLVLSASSESVSMLIRALASHRTVNVLSRPQVLALDNQLAQIQVGQEVPRVEGVTISGTGLANPNVNYDSAGIILTVSPRISSDGQIVMEIAAEKSEYTGAGVPIFTDAANGNVIESPIKDIINALTTVKVPDGQTVVVGGMITRRDVHEERKVPWLADIPIVGNVFRYDYRQGRRTELLIFLTPRIIHNDADSELIKEVELGRIHYFLDHLEEAHGPIFGIPGQEQTTPATPPSGTEPPAFVPPLPGAPVPPPTDTPSTGPQARLSTKSRVQQAAHTRASAR